MVFDIEDSLFSDFREGINDMIKNVWDKSKTLVNKNIWKKTSDVLISGMEKGYLQSTDKLYSKDIDLQQKLRENIKKFSAFKNHSNIQDLVKLVDKSSDFESFATEAKKISLEYNQHWLKTEFEYVKNSSKNAALYAKAQREVHEYPYLTYHTQLDDRVRPKHKVLEGITLPVNHKFWDSHLPCKDFGCRCYVTQEATGTVSTNLPKLEEDFNFNTVKDGILFSESDSYFKGVPTTVKKELVDFLNANRNL